MEQLYKTMVRTLSFTLLLLTALAMPSYAQKTSPQQYIEQYKDAAIQHMKEHGCPASIILAIAMHESANGNSRVAKHLNNHFGIKGRNTSKIIRSAYKGYASVEESYEDFVNLLKRRKSTQKLFNQYMTDEYQEWVRGIARSGYAQSPTWATKVVGMIKKYNLHEFDERPEDATFVLNEEPDQTELYTVKKGDTLSAIAQKHGTTVKTIQRNNGLANSRLHIGQQLVL
ncbi:glucosaminidase domain and LysM peptidoglycan-binding domain-containing protein [Parapedobacter tibetensis]|uniref:glucosaminidase domain and LysM peptidoglycan-binding domain-containing protein n=1 Tax=Parapedobacter tibetensis TaxID=2972951 RepID=UPI00214DB8F2|nr:glucosaminidase domain-containing protein [Parapedobacter tibetensis]